MHTTKVVTFITVLLALVVFTSLYSFNTLSRTSKMLEDHVAKIEENTSSNNWSKAHEELSITQNSWSTVHNTWSVLLDHAEIDNIDSTLSRMGKYIETQDTPSALAEVAILRQYIRHIPEKEAFSLKNIF